MKNAEKFVWAEIDRIKEKHVFCHLCIPRRLHFLEHTRSRKKAEIAINNLKTWIATDGVLSKDRLDDGWGRYGKPHSLSYFPYTDTILKPIFSKETIESDIKGLIEKQKNDGRWDTWYGISEGTKLEWAGIQTFWTLKILKSYGRIKC